MSENPLKLQKEIERHNELYYRENTSEITDAEYDELVKEGGVQTVGASPDEKLLILQHVVPMVSLANVYKQEEVEEFLDTVKRLLNVSELEIISEPKIDGLSFTTIYENIKAATRGDGSEGEDVTSITATIEGLPKVLSNIMGRLEVRGKVYIRNDDVLKIK